MNKIFNFATALAEHIAAGSPEVTDDIFYKRLNICIKCDKLDKSKASLACGICGCYLEIKARWADQQCPDNPPKWESLIQLNTDKIWKKPDGCNCK